MYEVVGWLGAVMVLVAYGLVTRSGTSMPYHVLNAAGAGGLLVNAVHHRAFPATAVNVVWAVIALWGMALSVRRHGASRDTASG